MKKYFLLIALFIISVIGIIKINIINTQILSPVGNFQDNFEKISEEFGEDFSEFIMDKSPVKIYLGEEEDDSATVKVIDEEIKLTKNNPFLRLFSPIADFFKNTYKKIEDKVKGLAKDNSSYDETGKDSELSNVIGDYINSLEDE